MTRVSDRSVELVAQHLPTILEFVLVCSWIIALLSEGILASKGRNNVESRNTSIFAGRLSRPGLHISEFSPLNWYKDFGSFVLCGTGEYPKTVLKKGMRPFGTPL